MEGQDLSERLLLPTQTQQLTIANVVSVLVHVRDSS